MASPVNIRVQALIPFPPLVVGGQGLIVTKANGIWTVALNIPGLGTSVPNATQLNTDFVLVYDSIAKTNVKVPLSAFFVGGALLQRLATASPVVVAPNDQIINFNINAAATCALPSYATRAGMPLTFKDVGGHLSAVNTFTITPAGGETIDGQANIVLKTPFQRVTLIPANDGTSTGWGT